MQAEQKLSDTYLEESRDIKKEIQSQPITWYLDQIEDRQITQIHLNAAEVVFKAIIKDAPKEIQPHMLSTEVKREYPFFAQRQDENAVYGLPEVVEATVAFIETSAKMARGDQMLLYLGPSGAGKTTLVNTIIAGVEEYTKSIQPHLYAIEGCPIQEHPEHLFPPETRLRLKENLGKNITGELCPDCQKRWEDPKVTPEDWQVHPLVFSLKLGRAIGRIETDLTQHLDSKAVEKIDRIFLGSSRGILVIEEFFKHNPDFLKTTLDLIRGGRLHVADEHSAKTWLIGNLIIGHSNTKDMEDFLKEPKNKTLWESFKDRVKIVKVPFNLSLSNEIEIYKKTLRMGKIATYSTIAPKEEKPGIHLPESTFEVIAQVGVISRMLKSEVGGIDDIDFVKLELYDGKIPDKLPADKRNALLTEGRIKDGCEGFSPAFMERQLSNILTGAEKCANPLWALAELERNLGKPEATTYKDWLIKLTAVKKRYETTLKETILQSFREQFEEQCNILLNDYLDNAEAFCNKQKLRDPITEDEVEPDEKLMRSLEEQIGVSEDAKKGFRDGVFVKFSTFAKRGLQFEYTSHDQLKIAIEKKVIGNTSSVEEILRLLNPDEQQQKLKKEAQDRLIKVGFCSACARESMDYIREHRLI